MPYIYAIHVAIDMRTHTHTLTLFSGAWPSEMRKHRFCKSVWHFMRRVQCNVYVLLLLLSGVFIDAAGLIPLKNENGRVFVCALVPVRSSASAIASVFGIIAIGLCVFGASMVIY